MSHQIDKFLSSIVNLEGAERTRAYFDALDRLIAHPEFSNPEAKRLALARLLEFLEKIKIAFPNQRTKLDGKATSSIKILKILDNTEQEINTQIDYLNTAKSALVEAETVIQKLSEAEDRLASKIAARNEMEDCQKQAAATIETLEREIKSLSETLSVLDKGFEDNARGDLENLWSRLDANQNTFLDEVCQIEVLLIEAHRRLSQQLNDDNRILDGLGQTKVYEPGSISRLRKELISINERAREFEDQLRATIVSVGTSDRP